MKGYIGITSRPWYKYLSSVQLKGEYNFWRKGTSKFKALKKGDIFFFLVKNAPNVKEERKVYGYGYFERYEVNTIDEAWRKYKTNNGMTSVDELYKVMESIYGKRINSSIGCIILNEIKMFKNPVLLSQLNIMFDKSIVSGKSISSEEAKSLVNELHRLNEEIFEFQKTIGYENDPLNEVFPEGVKSLRLHLSAERNPKLIERAKELFILKHGRLFCEVCEFDFEKNYGEIGKSFIEGHHIIPVSDLKDNEGTKVSDIVMLCSNCHSMIHRRRPWLGINELRFLKKN